MDGGHAVQFVSSLTSFMGLLKSIGDVLATTPNLDLREKIASAREQSLELRESAIKLKDENSVLKRKLRSAIKKLRKKRANQEVELHWGEWAFFREEDLITQNQPYCPTCYMNSREPSHLVVMNYPLKSAGSHRCSVCQKFHSKPK